MPDFGWSYPPGCSGVPADDDDDICICGLPVRRAYAYCGPSCEFADEEGTVDCDYPESINPNDIPFVLARSFANPFHIPSDNELTTKELRKETE